MVKGLEFFCVLSENIQSQTEKSQNYLTPALHHGFDKIICAQRCFCCGQWVCCQQTSSRFKAHTKKFDKDFYSVKADTKKFLIAVVKKLL